MPMITKDFDHYGIIYFSNKNQMETARIICLLNETNPVNFYFIKEQEPVLPPNYGSQNETIQLYFKMSQFNDIISILRYEKPLKIVYNTEQKWGFIATGSHEPVGEQEGV